MLASWLYIYTFEDHISLQSMELIWRTWYVRCLHRPGFAAAVNGAGTKRIAALFVHYDTFYINAETVEM